MPKKKTSSRKSNLLLSSQRMFFRWPLAAFVLVIVGIGTTVVLYSNAACSLKGGNCVDPSGPSGGGGSVSIDNGSYYTGNDYVNSHSSSSSSSADSSWYYGGSGSRSSSSSSSSRSSTPTPKATKTPTPKSATPKSAAPTPVPNNGSSGSSNPPATGGSNANSGANNSADDEVDDSDIEEDAGDDSDLVAEVSNEIEVPDEEIGDDVTVEVDGNEVSNDGKVDTRYLTNGDHTVTVKTTKDGKTQTRHVPVKVNNKLSGWETIRNYLFAPFHGNKVLVNGSVLVLAIVIVAIITYIFLRRRYLKRPHLALLR